MLKRIALFAVAVGCLVGLTAAVVSLSSGTKFGSARLSMGGPGLLIAKAAEKPSARPGSAKPAMTTRTLNRTSLGNGRSKARFELSYPVFTEEKSQALNAGIVKKLNAMLETDTSPEAAADGFVKQHAAFVAEFPENAASWHFSATVQCEGSVANLVCFAMSHHGYAGGAHGFSGSRYVMFDSATGDQVPWEDTVSPDTMRELVEIAERYFRKCRGLGANESLKDAGYWFKRRFSLDNAEIGLTSEGMIVHFNPCTIASNAMGSTTYRIPMEELVGVIGVQYALAGQLDDPF
jgi:hypothetical protein